MHLTEACLAAHEATGEVRFAEAARRLVELFRTKLFDVKTGTLAEYFTDDWSRGPGDDGRIVEPGHLMEWCWILNQARKQLGMDTGAEIRAAIRFAETHGVDAATGVTYNSVQLREDACQAGLKYCINKQSSQTEATAMPSQYRQNYTPNRRCRVGCSASSTGL